MVEERLQGRQAYLQRDNVVHAKEEEEDEKAQKQQPLKTDAHAE